MSFLWNPLFQRLVDCLAILAILRIIQAFRAYNLESFSNSKLQHGRKNCPKKASIAQKLDERTENNFRKRFVNFVKQFFNSQAFSVVRKHTQKHTQILMNFLWNPLLNVLVEKKTCARIIISIYCRPFVDFLRAKDINICLK